MTSPERHVFNIEQIADRWRTDPATVEHLIRTRQLPRALILTGPVRLHLRDQTGRPVLYPEPGTEGVHARLLISTWHITPGHFTWPLSQVRRIYDFLDGDRLGRVSLQQYCSLDKAKTLGWKVQFDSGQSQIEGLDGNLVELGDLVDCEAVMGLHAASKEQQAEGTRKRDRRKQRCRVAASILWRTDRSLTLASVFRHPWVQEEACEGRPPTEKAFREWVKDLNPDRRPGRRRRTAGGGLGPSSGSA